MEAERHRKTLSHRTRVKRTRGQSTEVSCQYCPQRLESLVHLKDHIWSEHKGEVSQCGLCGESFALAQELAVHVRSKCRLHVGGRRLSDDGVDDKNIEQRCHVPGCEFACSSLVMMLLHQSLKVKWNSLWPFFWQYTVLHYFFYFKPIFVENKLSFSEANYTSCCLKEITENI